MPSRIGVAMMLTLGALAQRNDLSAAQLPPILRPLFRRMPDVDCRATKTSEFASPQPDVVGAGFVSGASAILAASGT